MMQDHVRLCDPGIVRLGQVPGGWHVALLSNAFCVITGMSPWDCVGGRSHRWEVTQVGGRAGGLQRIYMVERRLGIYKLILNLARANSAFADS